MLTPTMKAILEESRDTGWVLEPQAKRLFREAGFQCPGSVEARTLDQALDFSEMNGFPVVAKCVSPDILHKTEYGAVIPSITHPEMLTAAFEKLMSLPGARAVFVESMVNGVEIIVGSKKDFQFGPVVLLGTGGTGVELYSDVAIRMAPIKAPDVASMVASLMGRAVFDGFRGAPKVNMEMLTDMVVRFSHLVMALENHVESVDLNPVICNPEACFIADARIILPAQLY